MSDPAGRLLLSEQQQLYFERARHGSSIVSNAAVRVLADVDETALRRAWAVVTARHGSLRARFVLEAGTPYAVVDVATPVELVDASEWSATMLRAQLAEGDSRTADLEAGGLVRLRVYRCGPRDSVIQLVDNHIVSDMLSVDTVLSDLVTAYLSELSAVPAQLPPVTGSYQSYVQRQRTLLASPDGFAMADWWASRLQGASTSSFAPKRTAVRPSTSGEGAFSFTFAPEFTSRLIALNPRLYRTLLTMYFILLSGRSGDEDVLVGSAGDTRSRALDLGVTGNYTNLLALRLAVRRDSTFGDLQQSVDDLVDQAAKRRQYPHERVRERLAPGGQRLTRAYFGMVSLPSLPSLSAIIMDHSWRSRVGEVELQSVRYDRARTRERKPRDEIGLWVARLDGKLLLRFLYDRELFDADDAAQLAGAFVAVCRGAMSDTKVRVAELLAAAEVALTVDEGAEFE